MYIVTRDRRRARTALEHLAAGLPVPTGDVHEVPVGDRRLLWCRAQVRDNLHVHADGILIGKHAASEELRDEPIRHDGPLPDSLPPALPGVVVRSEPDGVSVEPLGVTPAYVYDTDVSDRQLLLAAMHGLRPGANGAALLAGLGFFPGNLTLFDEVSRIPFLHRWRLPEATAQRTRHLERPRADDDGLIDRLVSIVPTDVSHAVGLSGGYDSRFTLAIVRLAGVDLRIVRFADRETTTAEAVAAQLGVQVESVGDFSDHDGERSSAEYTLLTDALIWHGVAQFGRLRQHLDPSDVFSSGQFSDAMTKNTLKTAWKKPDPRTPFWDRLVRDGFMGNVPSTQPALRELNRREEVTDLVGNALQYQREYVDFGKRKQLANWLHYMNRGMRWAQAYYDDLTFSTNLLFLLSDIDAQLLGIGSPAWENFHNDRVRLLTHRLLPEVTVDYSGGAPAEPRSNPGAAVEKLRYEYFDRWRTSRTARARLEGIETTYEDALPPEQPEGHDQLFDRPMREVAHMGRFGLRRANVTISNVLTFLAAMPEQGDDTELGPFPDTSET